MRSIKSVGVKWCVEECVHEYLVNGTRNLDLSRAHSTNAYTHTQWVQKSMTNNNSYVWGVEGRGGGMRERISCMGSGRGGMRERILCMGSRGGEKGNTHISIHMQHRHAQIEHRARVLATPPPRHNSVLHNSSHSTQYLQYKEAPFHHTTTA